MLSLLSQPKFVVYC